MVCNFHTVKISNLTEVSVTEMPASDTVFQEFLEINAHAHTVDTRHSFPPSPISALENKANPTARKFGRNQDGQKCQFFHVGNF